MYQRANEQFSAWINIPRPWLHANTNTRTSTHTMQYNTMGYMLLHSYMYCLDWFALRVYMCLTSCLRVYILLCVIDQIRHIDAILYNIHHIYYFVWTDIKSHQQACMHAYVHPYTHTAAGLMTWRCRYFHLDSSGGSCRSDTYIWRSCPKRRSQ